ncbi:hypothetical protein ACWJJ5_04100 [Bacillus sp. JK74]|uniref:hypothetical protein n=1 Tax=Bacillus velezensis TaxID=492670 RepID=UPI0013DFC694|nr:hypothetical protein [Bacillus velezensis]
MAYAQAKEVEHNHIQGMSGMKKAHRFSARRLESNIQDASRDNREKQSFSIKICFI